MFLWKSQSLSLRLRCYAHKVPGSPSGVVYAAWRAAGVGASCAGGVTAGSGRDTRGRCHTCFQWGRKGWQKNSLKSWQRISSKSLRNFEIYIARPPELPVSKLPSSKQKSPQFRKFILQGLAHLLAPLRCSGGVDTRDMRPCRAGSGWGIYLGPMGSPVHLQNLRYTEHPWY